MKYFVTMLILVGLIGFVAIFSQYADGTCVSGTDWDKVPCESRTCYDNEPPTACTDPNWWKKGWAPYYDYKGSEWMNQKKIELLDAIKTNTLAEWKNLTPNGTNSNVHDYYFYMGEVPNDKGIYVKQYFANYFPPLKQIKSGISSQQVSCKDGLELVVKSSNNSPACVKPKSIPKLIERGWMDSIEYYNRQCETSPWTCSHEVPKDLVDLDKFKDDSLKKEILTQLRKEPKNLNDIAKEFILSEALSDKHVSVLLGDSKYQIMWMVNSELGESSIKYFYGMTFQLNEKDLVNVVYDLQQEKITLVEIGEVFGSSSGEEISSESLYGNQTEKHSIPLTLFPVTPQNVTLPDTTKQTQTFTNRISINKINQLKITNSDSTNGQKTHLAQLSINGVALHTKDIENLPAKPGFDTLVFDYTITSRDNDAFYAMLDFEIQVGSKKYPTLLSGGDFSEILLPDEKRDSSFAIQVGKDANQVILNVRDSITQKTLWTIPVDLKPFNIKYKPEEGILVQENED